MMAAVFSVCAWSKVSHAERHKESELVDEEKRLFNLIYSGVQGHRVWVRQCVLQALVI